MSVLDLDDLDAIRRPTPTLDRAWVIGFALIALGGFASGFIQQAIGPFGIQPPADVVAPVPVAVTQPPAQAPRPSVKPAMQVAVSAPEPEPPVKLDVPEPLVITPEPAAPAVAATVEAAAAPSAESPAAEPLAEPVAPVPAEPAAELEEPPAA